MSQRREMRIRRVVSWTLVMAVFCTSAHGRTIRVGNDLSANYPTIQAAIDDANDGDIVLVAPGTYTGEGNRDITIHEKAITVRSEKGAGSCIIDCRDNGPGGHTGFWLLNGYTPTPGMPVVEGFTITGAHGRWGGGIYCGGGSPRIANCIIVGNTGELAGGGILCDACSDVTIANCVISGNMTPSPASAARGVQRSGGGICITNGQHATLTNCLITGNRSVGHGAGVQCSSATIVNCTISGNYTSPGRGNGISAGGGEEDALVVRNSIVYGNGGLDISIVSYPGSLPHMSCRTEHSLVGIAPSCQPQGVPGLPLDQLFARVDYWDPNDTPDDPNDDFWVQGDYHLKSQTGRWDPVSETWVKDDITSPAIDAGDPNSLVGAEPFPNGGRINMGAYGGTAEASKSLSGLHTPSGDGAAYGRIIRVGNDPSADYPTIQAAVDACANGDTVLVAPGIYVGDGNRDIDFRGKAITVRSEQGAESTVVDCQGSAAEPHRGFYFHNAEDANSVLRGFTIRNGYVSERGGAVYCWMASPHIMDCVLSGCTATKGGGGLAAIYSSTLAEGCIVVANRADPGGGIMSSNDGPVAYSPTFVRCIIAGNQARGGYGGGGIWLNGDATFINCTLCDNRAPYPNQYGGGLYCGSAYSDRVTLRNCIIWGNTSPRGSEIAVLGNVGILGTMSATVEYSLLGTDPSGIFDPEGHVRGRWLQADPLLGRVGHWDANGTPNDFNNDFFVPGDYHLMSEAGRWDPESQSWVKDEVTSPCIDAGDSNSPVGTEPFPNGGRINMGAYGGTAEASKSPSGLHGPYGGEGGYGRTIRVGNGPSADYPMIQAAVDAANDGDTVLVAPGTYSGDGNRDIDFKGKAITVKSEAGPRTCIIDSQGSSTAWRRGFYFHSGEQADSVLDGFTITGGIQYIYSGGGILCSESSPTIRNCIIVGNAAPEGGGLALSGSAVVSNCIIAGNRTLSVGTAHQIGGALVCDGDGHVILRNCTLYANRARSGGGGVEAGLGRKGKLSLVNCILFGNRSTNGGNQISRAPTNMVVPAIGVETRNCLIEDDPNALGGSVHLSDLIDCIWGDPLFANPGHWDSDLIPTSWTDGDYHLQSQAGRWGPNSASWVQDDLTSPCIDAGDPSTPIGGEPFPNGGRINMGAYGGTAEASKSPSGLHARYGGGAGEPNDPYLIYTAEQFKAIGAHPVD